MLVGDGLPWQLAVQEAASRRAAELDIVPTIKQAMARMLPADQVFTHVLAILPLDDRGLDALTAMLDEVTSPHGALILLGEHDATHLHAVARPDPDLLAAALDSATPTSRQAPGVLDGKDIAASLFGGRLRMRYQPIVRAGDLVPVGIEALARLQDDTRGILHPRDFIDRAVEAGLERVLTSIVAARSMIELRAAGDLPEIFLSLNMPLPTLLHPDARKRGPELCAVANVTPARIMLEALETRDPPDFCALSKALEEWRGMGFQIAIDDAGPALPHWQAMLDLPFTTLKLDGRLVADPEGHELTARIVDGAKQRGLSVIAEGIEDAAILARMRGLGVDAFQGFFISRPLPAMAVPLWITQWQAGVRSRAA